MDKKSVVIGVLNISRDQSPYYPQVLIENFGDLSRFFPTASIGIGLKNKVLLEITDGNAPRELNHSCVLLAEISGSSVFTILRRGNIADINAGDPVDTI